MTPAARVQTAIELLDQILAGAPAEKTLTGWARKSRFAGSKDRAAVRDHVYDALRRRQSAARIGGALTGRGIMLGLLMQDGADADALFSGPPYAPEPLSDLEKEMMSSSADVAPLEDIPEWMLPMLQDTLGDEIDENVEKMRQRAPVFLRVNLQKTTVEQAVLQLKGEGVLAEPHPLSDTALRVTEGARRVSNTETFRDGYVELQDVSSQAAIQSLSLKTGMRVLDFCAGGGGKVLAMAGRCEAAYVAHDANATRMKDLPLRGKRAGAAIQIKSLEEIEKAAKFDLVFCDVPCSGSGTWRRTPDAKWRFQKEDLEALTALQAEILQTASRFVEAGGILAYATCSLFPPENSDQIAAFLAQNPDWQCVSERQWRLDEGSDGFYLAKLART
ncbi:RsmB/NOP family class I SAM-dependent RNA methyltransferase [Shimia thalassica]|uniref:RsmB/NOP family class I SAM-dependent RNA methyltransferase n=1 Tax=Shimia thalassica TaxID=1715693 RepID=UPI0026E23D4A|nr:RsmB/NOP family class I SAM-dependent RNA methyltransferase [Shimia thalassica]MDO6483037.1 RsmB/NOP family class I SAM-dependent RNA methyltransferase [Shimia thalassica]